MKNHKPNSTIFIPFLFAAAICCLFLRGCAGVPVMPYEEMSPRQRVVYMMGIYNMQYEGYRAKAVMPGLTERQKDLLREKRAMLANVYPMIQAYDLYVSAGNMPDGNMEREIMDLLDALERLTVN